MSLQPCDLADELERGSAGLVCLTGAGGKTTLLYALGEAFAARGQSVLCTTTTRMFRPLSTSMLSVEFCEEPSRLAPPARGLLAARPAPPGADQAKVYGYSAQEVDRLFARCFAHWIFVEADGASGRPIKAPARHEPVIPARATCVIGLIGLGCFRGLCTPEYVFRPEIFSALTGAAPGARLTPEAVARLVLHPQGLFKAAPPTARRLLFCNQADIPGAEEAFLHLAKALFAANPRFLDGCYAGSLRQQGLRCSRFLLPVTAQPSGADLQAARKKKDMA